MKHNIFILLFLLVNTFNIAQIELSRNGKYRVYRSLKETEGVNPDSIHFLDLGNNGLKAFPKEVLKFKNLLVLDFENKDNDYYYNFRPSMLTEAERKKIENTRHINHRTLEVDGHVKNKNRFSKIPNEIASLQKLEILTIKNKTYTNGNTTKTDSIYRPHIYLNIEETINVNPDSVYYLDLSNSGLKVFPIEVLKFKNLSQLVLTNYHDSFYFHIKQKVQADTTMNFSTNYYWEIRDKKNTFKEIPKEIASLTKLQVLIIAKKHHTKQLKQYLPECDFFDH